MKNEVIIKNSKEFRNMALDVATSDSYDTKKNKQKKGIQVVPNYERMQLKAFRYKGYRYIERVGLGKVSITGPSLEEITFRGSFKNLKENKKYLIADVIENRIFIEISAPVRKRRCRR